MFTRSTFETPDMHEQGVLLAKVAELVDAGRVKTTANAVLGRIDAENLTRAHALLESGKAVGKIVLEGS
jgi:NADPH:quinone reductase-like Zn-dependent oxidoreductase